MCPLMCLMWFLTPCITTYVYLCALCGSLTPSITTYVSLSALCGSKNSHNLTIKQTTPAPLHQFSRTELVQS
jgi:hypothetical protein